MPLKDHNTARALVSALVDAIQYPAFVTSPTMGLVAINKSAKAITKKDLSNHSWLDGTSLELNGKLYRVINKKLNHKTDCVLIELHEVSDPVERFKFAGKVLDKALSGAF